VPTNSPILIAGAGPTGLVLALMLARRGVPFRLVTDAPGPGEHSRAMVVHARTLEFYRQFGFADEVVAQGIRTDAIHLREVNEHGIGREVTSVGFADVGGDISPYPFILTYPQDLHERFLVGKLEALGVKIEWNTRLTGFEQDADGVRVAIRHADGREETADASYICGCDGGHSEVRHSAGVGFSGGTYDQLFHVADVRLEGEFEPDLRVNLGPRILELVMPVRTTGMSRLIGLVPPELSQLQGLTFDDLRPHIERLVDRRILEVNWFSTYRVHHRIADHFRIGRAFLAGDAGHVHSPAGGQGMNTGIGDAVNLGWKLAQVWAGNAPDVLLDSYESERIGFARQLVATTDRAFRPMVASGIGGEAMRRLVAPFVVGIATRFSFTRHALFRSLSQTQIHYSDSPLSRGCAGDVCGGHRLPWIADADNFGPLRSMDWQVHVFGAASEKLRLLCAGVGLPIHEQRWTTGAQTAGYDRDGAYLIRPDGYVAAAASQSDAPAVFGAFIADTGIRFAAADVRRPDS